MRHIRRWYLANMVHYPLPTILANMAHAPYSHDKIKFSEYGALPPITLTSREGVVSDLNTFKKSNFRHPKVVRKGIVSTSSWKQIFRKNKCFWKVKFEWFWPKSPFWDDNWRFEVGVKSNPSHRIYSGNQNPPKSRWRRGLTESLWKQKKRSKLVFGNSQKIAERSNKPFLNYLRPKFGGQI